MQQDKQHFENKLKQLENQQLPDMSQLETHWSTMQEMLGNATTVSPKKSAGNTTGLIAAAIILVSMSLIVYQFNDNRKNVAEKNTAVKQEQKNNPVTATPPLNNIIQSNTAVSKPKKKNHNHICQNVPTCTAKFIVEQAVKFVEGKLPDSGLKYLKQDNWNKRIVAYDTESPPTLSDL